MSRVRSLLIYVSPSLTCLFCSLFFVHYFMYNAKLAAVRYLKGHGFLRNVSVFFQYG